LLQKRKESAAKRKRKPLREKEDNQEKVVCGEENKNERVKYCCL